MPNSNRPGPSSGGTGKKVVTRGPDAGGAGEKVITRGPNRQLTRRQEKFVKELVANDGLITMREAATRAGYPAASAHSRAYELTNNNICPHVVAEIKRYRDELDEQYGVTYKRHIRDMQKLRDAALDNGAYSAAVMAEKNRGLAEGLYVSKSEIRTGSIDSMSREQVEAELERLRSSFEPIIDITPTKVEESDAEGGGEESGSGPVATDIGRAEEDGAKD
jgi:phage terminase small subunit